MVEGIDKSSTVYTPPPVGTPEYDRFMKNISEKLLTILEEQKDSGGMPGKSGYPVKPELGSPGISGLEVADILAGLKSKINEAMEGVTKESIEKSRSDQKEKSQERLKQLQEAKDAMARADVWGVVGKVLGWAIPVAMTLLGAALATVGGICLVTGAGTAVGVAFLSVGASLVAGGLVGLGAQILQETGAAQAIMDFMAEGFESMGMSKEAAMWTSLILYQVAVTAVMLTASIGAGLAVGAIGGAIGGAAGGASTAASATAQAAATGASATAQAVATGASAGAQATATGASVTAQVVAKATKVLLTLGVSLVQAAAQLSQSGVSVGKAIDEKQAMDHKAEAQKINAMLKKLQQHLEEQAQQLQEILESWNKGISIVMGVIDSHNQAFQMTMRV